MSNPFDILQENSFNVVTATMGYDAAWTPLEGGDAQQGRVLFKDPTEMSELAGMEYSPVGFMMEYRFGAFSGLFESVRIGNPEKVSVNGIMYYVRDVKSVYDGKTFRAKIEPTKQ